MKNVYMTPLSYKDFDGNKRNTQLHFHLTPREFADWMIDNRDAARQLQKDFSEMQDLMADNPEGDASEDQKMAMLRLVRILCELAYGVPESAEVFDKSGNAKFRYSAAYDAFRLFLFQNVKELEQFTSTLLNEEVVNEFTNNMLAEPEDAPSLAKRSSGGKDPKNMTKAELLELMQERNQAPAPVQ